VEDLSTTADDVQVKVTVSIGISTLSNDTPCEIQGCEDLVKHADAALYRAKNGGRNRVEIG
jgi:diguanylate cyclase (GGDEF)-like protein